MIDPRAPRKTFPILLLQLVIANILVAVAVTGTLYVLFTRLMDTYFARLMHEFDISPTKLNSMFTSDVEQSLWWGILVALMLGIALSWLLTKTLLRPISKMVQATEKIAHGDLSARAPELKGELGALSWHMNHMASALESQEQVRQQLLRDLSHELRTPLTNVKGYIEGLEDGVFQPGPEVFTVLNAEVSRLSGLIDDLSELSFSEETPDRTRLEPVDLRAQVDNVIVAHRARMVEAGFTLSVREFGTSARVHTDPGKLQQIFNNAVTNMVHYADCRSAPDRQTMSASCDGTVILDWTDPSQVKICFENWAEPISHEDMKHLFDRFYRVDKSRSGKANNVGLGLAIVKRLVGGLGGRVWASQTAGRFQLFVALPKSDIQGRA